LAARQGILAIYPACGYELQEELDFPDQSGALEAQYLLRRPFSVWRCPATELERPVIRLNVEWSK